MIEGPESSISHAYSLGITGDVSSQMEYQIIYLINSQRSFGINECACAE